MDDTYHEYHESKSPPRIFKNIPAKVFTRCMKITVVVAVSYVLYNTTGYRPKF
jgi:hypothetical protein